MSKVSNDKIIIDKTNGKKQMDFETKQNAISFFGLLLKIDIKIIKITKLKNEKESKFSMDNPIVFIITMLILQYLLK